jgi:hypothetical protein
LPATLIRERLAEERVCYHAAFAAWYYRQEQAHWRYQSLRGLMLPMARKSIEPLPLALDGGDLQAMRPCIKHPSRDIAGVV